MATWPLPGVVGKWEIRGLIPTGEVISACFHPAELLFACLVLVSWTYGVQRAQDSPSSEATSA